jgi:hypothetical protein
MLLSGGKGKEVSGSLSPLPAESKVFVYKLVGVCWSGRSEAPLPDQANQTNLLITHKKEPKDHQPRPCHVNTKCWLGKGSFASSFPNLTLVFHDKEVVGWGWEAPLPPTTPTSLT